MNDDDMKNGLKSAYRAAEGKPPPFARTWAAAESRHAGSVNRRRLVGGLAAAAAVAAVTVALWPSQQAELTDEYLIADSLLNSTSWAAPSDSLMPEHQFDIYGEFPFPEASTNEQEGTLL